MATTVTNTEALGNKISELQTLHDTWADKTYTAVFLQCPVRAPVPGTPNAHSGQ